MKAFAAPAVESLLYYAKSIWPSRVSDDQEFQRLVARRQSLCDNVEYLVDLLLQRNKTIMELTEDKADFQKIAATYDDLADFISEKEVNSRIIFYLPFEMIPDAKFVLGINKIQLAAHNFLSSYMKAWCKLLFVHELRVNFVDGDISELSSERGNELFVCKAAHLIPVLLQKKIIDFSEVVKMIKGSSTQTLSNSLIDAILATADLNIITNDQLRMSLNPKILGYYVSNIKPQVVNQNASIIKTGAELTALIATALRECDRSRKECIKDSASLSPARSAWLQEVNCQRVIASYAEIIADSVANNHLPMDIMLEYFSGRQDTEFLLLAVGALRVTIEKINEINFKFTSSMAYYVKPWLDRTWATDEVAVKMAIESTLHHWFNAGIVNAGYLSEFNLNPIDLDDKISSDNVCSDQEFYELTQVLNAIKNSEPFSEYFYPVFNLYGSRVKGYGSKFTDIDLAVFVKPGVDPLKKDLVTAKITELLKHEKIKGRVLQFWLTKHEEYLVVGNHFNGDKLMGNSSYAHVLFGGAWFGDFDFIKKFHSKLLTPYLFTSNDALVETCLRELERDNLQYRLLHKGYDYLFPKGKRLNTHHINADCCFYDSGYRTLATKLFLKKVFLPRLGA